MAGGQQSNWFVKDEGGVRGPLSEAEMRQQVTQSSSAGLQVRQGESAWHPADQIRSKIKELAASGIYVKMDAEAEGPFTLTKAYELLQKISRDGIEVKTGARGEWVPAETWLAKVRKLHRKHQREMQSMADAIQRAKDISDSDEIILEAIILEEEVFEATVVEEPMPTAVPVAPVLNTGAVPVQAVPVQAVPVQAVPVQAVPAEPRPARSHSPQRPSARPTNPKARKKKQKKSRGVMPIVVGGIVSFCLVLAAVGAVLYFRSPGGDAESSRTEIPSDTVGSPSGNRPPSFAGADPSRMPTAVGSDRSPMGRPPIVVPGTLFRPQFQTAYGEVDAGTAFAARISGKQGTLIVSALHLFGPAGGLDQEIPASQLPVKWQGVSLEDCRTRRLYSDLPITPILLAQAKPLPDSSPQGDVAVCSVQSLPGLRFKALALSPRSPQAGERVWLVSEVIGSPSMVHAAIVNGFEDGWLAYRFERPGVQLRATSGAPVVDRWGQVVAVNVGGGEQNGRTIGVGTPVQKFLDAVANHL